MRSKLPPTALVALLLLAGCAAHESGDQCKDDVDNDGDGVIDCADPDCFLAPSCQRCGDGVVDDNEACDDGNLKDGDGCSHLCLLDNCGNGRLDPLEECDDGNLVAGDGCNFRCKVDHCGNARIDPGEFCDDGNAVSGDGCSSTCQVESGVTGGKCGNLQFDPGEECDDGNVRDNDGCSHLCKAEFCGDHVKQSFEACDGTDTPPGSLCVNCTVTFCGNGVVEADRGEECDDGNQNFGDGCSNCKHDRCGDFFISGAEQCDDGNTVAGDGCSATCRVERCGDHVLQPRLGELCDDASADCVDCIPTRACASGLCFSVSKAQPFVQATNTVFARGAAPQVVVGSAQSQVVHFNIANGRLGDAVFGPGFQAVPALRSDDLDGDGTDELVAGGVDGSFGRIDQFGQLEVLTFFPNQDRVIDIALGDIGGGARKDAAAVALHKDLVIAVDPFDPQVAPVVLTAQLPFTATRVAVLDGVVAVAGGTHVTTARVNASDAIVLGDELAVDAQVADLAAADVDFDGDLDLVLLEQAPDRIVALLMDDTGALATTPTAIADAPGADTLSAADVDGDGDTDLITARDGAVVLYLAHDGYAASAPLPCPDQPTRVDAKDIDGDGDIDLVYSGGFFQPVTILLMRQ